MEKEAKTQKTDNPISVETKQTCGIVMPISAIDNCSAKHWQDVKSILSKAIIDAGYVAHIVSDADDSGVIQKRIVQNLYDNEIVVCDVSCKNSNVMFELGMRLAFDKPTIIVSDEKTSFSFDTGLIEHLIYPRDLAYFDIIDFQCKLTEKIKGTIEASKKPDYTTFLKNFGEFKVATIEHKKGDINQALLEKLSEISLRLNVLETNERKGVFENSINDEEFIDQVSRLVQVFCDKRGITISKDWYESNRADLIDYVKHYPRFRNFSIRKIVQAVDDYVEASCSLL